MSEKIYDIVEQNSKKSNKYFWLYVSYVNHKPIFLRITKGASINVGVIPCDFFYREVVIFQWRASIECWVFLPHITHFYM